MAWLDIALIALVVIGALVGTYRGFFKSLFQLCGTLVTLVISILLAKPVAGLLNSWFDLSSTLGNAMMGHIEPICQASGGGALQNFFLNKFAEIMMGQDYNQYIMNGQTQSVEFMNELSGHIGTVLCTVIAVAILFILIRLTLLILNKVFEKFTKNKSISGFNRLLGFVLGAAKGALFVCILLVGAYLLSPVVPMVGEWVSTLLEQNPISNNVFNFLADFTDNTLLPWFDSVINN